MVADAFRIAFEQQLRKQNENFLFLTEANFLKCHQHEDEGKFINPVNLSIIFASILFKMLLFANITVFVLVIVLIKKFSFFSPHDHI